MSFLSHWCRLGLACLGLALVFAAPLSAGTITMEFETAQSSGFLVLRNPSETIVAGCIPNGYRYRTSSMGGAADFPAKAAGKDYHLLQRLGIGSVDAAQITWTGLSAGNPVVNVTTPFRLFAIALNGSTEVGAHTIWVPVQIKMKFKSGINTSAFVITGAPVTYSLKVGAFASGTGPLPTGEDGIGGTPTPANDKWNVITDAPAYKIDENGRVIDLPPPTYDVSGKQGNWGSGPNWHEVTAPSATGVPLWIAIPGAGAVTDDGGGKWIIGIVGMNVGGGSVARLPDGSVRAFVYPPGNPAWGQNYYFPPGSVKKKDLAPSATPPPAALPIDNCFTQAATDLGLNPSTPPPVTPPPSNPSRPDPILPSDPGIIGGPSNPGAGGGGQAGGGSGGGGGSAPGPTIPGPGGGGTAPGGPGIGPGTGDGEAPSVPLPGDGDAQKLADDLARGYAKSVNDAQNAAGPLARWAAIEPFSPGIGGPWVVSLPVNGANYSMTIPTTHAPLIRALLLVLLQVCFVIACFNQLTR